MGVCILIPLYSGGRFRPPLVSCCNLSNHLTFTTFWTVSADDKLIMIFFIVLEKALIFHIKAYFLGKQQYIEDIYSFVVNTKENALNIFIECNENISIFMSAKH